MITPFQSLACPLDGAALHLNAGSWCCDAGHTYDVAAQGYTHLLPVQQKRSKDPGDSKEMIAARRRFLEAGFYAPIADAVSRVHWAGVTTGETTHCLDAGCGDGYYLRRLAQARPAGTTLSAIGLDISKWAIQAAARQEKYMRWVVASNAHIPVQAATLDRVLCMFGFPVYPEFARVLKPGGCLIQVDAAPDHLRELREIIYPSLKPEREDSTAVPDGFVLRDTEVLRYALDIPTADPIADLLVMTPHFYRAAPEGREKAAALAHLTLTVAVKITTFERQA